MTSKSFQDAFAIFVGEFAAPEATRLGQESMQSIDVVVEQLQDGDVVQRRKFTASPEHASGTLASGLVRVKFRSSGNGSSFRAQAIFRELAKGTGFSGFAVRGKIRSGQVDLTGLTYRYNVWEWDQEFRR